MKNREVIERLQKLSPDDEFTVSNCFKPDYFIDMCNAGFSNEEIDQFKQTQRKQLPLLETLLESDNVKSLLVTKGLRVNKEQLAAFKEFIEA